MLDICGAGNTPHFLDPEKAATLAAYLRARDRHKTEKPEKGFHIAKREMTWHGLKLQAGMVYGVHNGCYYATTGEIIARRNGVNTLQVYRERGNENIFSWVSSQVADNESLGRALAAAIKKRNSGAPSPAKRFKGQRMPRKEVEALMAPSTKPRGNWGFME